MFIGGSSTRLERLNDHQPLLGKSQDQKEKRGAK